MQTSADFIPPADKSRTIKSNIFVDSASYAPVDHTAGVLNEADTRYSSELKSRSFNITWYFINQTGAPVTVSDRSGLCTVVEPNQNIVNGDIIIRKCIHLENLSLQAAIRAVSRLASTDNLDAAQLRAGLYKTKKANFTSVSIQIDYISARETITAKGGTVYNYQTDFVLSVDDVLTVAPHPYSSEYLDLSGFGRFTDFSNQLDLSIKIKYVSYNNKASKKFVNILGTVFVLTPQSRGPMKNIRTSNGQSKPSSDYIQVTYTSECAYGNTAKGMTTLTLDMNEAGVVLGMFDTYEDALAFGDPESRHKRNILELSQTLELLKNQNLLDKQRMDAMESAHKAEQFTRDKQLENIRYENNKLKTEADAAASKHAIDVHNLKVQALAREASYAQTEHNRKILEDKLRQAEIERVRLDRIHEENIRRERANYDFNLSVARDAQKDKITAVKDKRDAGLGLLKIIPAAIIGIGGIAALLTKPSAKS